MAALTPTCAYRVDADLCERLDRCLGAPLDSYVRGWQVWLEPNGPGGMTLEWRLHPPAGFEMPPAVDHRDLFDTVLAAVADSADPDREPLTLGADRRRLREVWEVLEVYPAYGGDPDPARLVEAARTALDGRAPDAAGRVDHGRMGDLWKARRGRYSVGAALFETLAPVP